MRWHYRIFNTRNIRETIDSFARGPYVSSFWLICVRFVDKNANRDQNVSFDLIYLQLSGVYTPIFTYVPYMACIRNRPHKHTHTNKKNTVCLMTSAHLSNFHHDECISFLITQLPKNKRKFIPKILKVHINRIQLYLYSSRPRNKCKPKP